MASPLSTHRTDGPNQRTFRLAKQTASQVALAIEPTEISAIFGVEDPELAATLLRQLLSFLHVDPAKVLDVSTVDEALAQIKGIGPNGAIEAMTATMLVGAYRAATDSLRRAAHPNQTPAGRALYQTLALKSMRTFAQLLETLHVGRGKAVRQEINVTHTHVTVESGGKAVLGIDAGRGRG
jgi:hypothetical protein